MEVLRKFLLTSAICLLLALSGCNDETPKSYDINSAPVIVRALGCDNEDLTKSGCVGKVRLYIYNENKDLIEWIDINKKDIINSKPICVKYPQNKRIYIEAVNLTSNNDIIYPEWKHFLHEFSLTFKAVEEMSNTEEIFLGSTIYDNTKNETSAHIIDIKRTVGKMRIQLSGNTDNQNSFHISIDKITAQINHEKTGYDERLGIVPELHNIGDHMSTNYFSTFPSEEKSGIIVNIFKNNTLVNSLNKDINGNLFQNAIDKTLEINIELSSLTAEVSISPWISVETDIEI